MCGVDGQVQETIGYGVASVFTPAENRGKGYARHMMRLLHWVLAKEGSLNPERFPEEWGSPPDRVPWVGDGSFSTLYSDVGPDFYANCGPYPEAKGWVVDEPYSTIWEVEDILAATATIQGEPESGWMWFDEASVKGSWVLDAKLMKEEMAAAPGEMGKTKIAFLPTQGVARSQLERLREHWTRMKPFPNYWAVGGTSFPAQPEGDARGISPFASWTFKYQFSGTPVAERLLVTRLRASAEDFGSLLKQLAVYAKARGLREIEVWGLPAQLAGLVPNLKARTGWRDVNLSSIAWYEENSPSWMWNESFAYC